MAEQPKRIDFTATDALLGRVRGRIGSGDDQNALSDDATKAYRIADEWERAVDHLAAESRLAASGRRFREQYPALSRWRERTLANRRRSTPRDVAAAFEALALECALAGETELAGRARAQAVAALVGNRPEPGAEPVTEARSA